MYNRQDAVEYAFQWWNKRNPSFYNFDSLGGDCTNFVSQCLFYGGIPMDYSQNGWFYNSLNSRSPSWTGVDEFHNYAIKNDNSVGVSAKEVNIFNLEVGDIVLLKLKDENSFHHAMIVTKIFDNRNFSDILVTCHSADAINKKLSSYYIKDIRFLKIIN